jgi:RecB family exonuclease
MVPDCFSPSALGSAGSCKLRLVVASLPYSQWPERLVSGPDASIGTILHRVLERSGRELGVSAEDVFQQEYERAVEEIRRDPRRAHFAELASTKSLSEWSRRKAWVLAHANHQQSKSEFRPPAVSARMPITGAEVILESTKLRLRGKADRVRNLGRGLFEVRDFKTGAVLNQQGDIKQEIVLQLQAYGLLLLERLPHADIRLVVDDGEERDIPFDRESRTLATTALEHITDAMPKAGMSLATALATPGQSCWGCPIRHVCSAYIACAPSWWKNYPAGVDRISGDVWGTVLTIEGTTHIDMSVRDDAGRRIKVDGLDKRHCVAAEDVGNKIWLFGLEATGATRGFDGSRFQPRYFHELPRDRTERRAWAAHLFGSNANRK